MTSNLTPHIKPYRDSVESRWQEFRNKRIKRRIKRPFIISLLIIILSSGTYIGRNYYANSNEQLFARYFKCYNITNDRTYSHMQAIKKYQDGDFEHAIIIFTELSSKDSILGPDDFYLAISYAKCGKYYEAIDLFKKITLDKNNFYKNSSNWYLGLCYLKMHECEKASEQFKLLLTKENEYRDDVLTVLRQMKD